MVDSRERRRRNQRRTGPLILLSLIGNCLYPSKALQPLGVSFGAAHREQQQRQQCRARRVLVGINGARRFHSTRRPLDSSKPNTSHRRGSIYNERKGVMDQRGVTIDVDRVRGDMLSVEYLHFNAAGDSPMPRPVLERIETHLRLEATVGGYEAARQVQEELEEVYDTVAELIGAGDGRTEVALVESATMAWAKAFYAFAAAAALQPGDVILTTPAEYAANYVAMLQVAKRTGAEVDVVPSTQEGELDLLSLERKLQSGTAKVCCLTHIPTNGGLVNPAEEVGELCRKYGVFYILDACQSCGQLDVNVQDILCDVLTATGRKYLRGPRGTGFLYVRASSLEALGEPPMIDHYGAPCLAVDRYELRPGARRFEFWEKSVANQLGLGAAIRYAQDLGMPNIEARVVGLADRLRRKIGAIGRGQVGSPGSGGGGTSGGTGGGGLVVCRDLGPRMSGLVSFTMSSVPAETLAARLRDHHRCFVSVSAPTSTVLDAAGRGLADVSFARASVHYFNTEEEVDRLAAILQQEAEGLQRPS